MGTICLLKCIGWYGNCETFVIVELVHGALIDRRHRDHFKCWAERGVASRLELCLICVKRRTHIKMTH